MIVRKQLYMWILKMKFFTRYIFFWLLLIVFCISVFHWLLPVTFQLSLWSFNFPFHAEQVTAREVSSNCAIILKRLHLWLHFGVNFKLNASDFELNDRTGGTLICKKFVIFTVLLLIPSIAVYSILFLNFPRWRTSKCQWATVVKPQLAFVVLFWWPSLSALHYCFPWTFTFIIDGLNNRTVC